MNETETTSTTNEYKIIVLGVGNELLTDEGIGVAVAKEYDIYFSLFCPMGISCLCIAF